MYIKLSRTQALVCSMQISMVGERVFTPIFSTGKWMAPMPGYLDHEKFGAWVCKMLINSPQNANLERPLPQFTATIYYMDKDTGVLKAVMEGVTITNYRTAAASVIATKYVYPGILQTEKVLSILGAGEIGKSHAEAFYHFFDFSEIRIWNRTAGRAKDLVNLLNKKYPKKIFKFFESNEDAVREADVVITATTPGPKPVLKFNWLKAGCQINAVGVSGKNSGHQELESEIYRQADIYTDNTKTALNGLAILSDPEAKKNLKGEIGEVVLGNLAPPGVGRISVFQSFGIPAQDCAMARMIFDAIHLQKNIN